MSGRSGYSRRLRVTTSTTYAASLARVSNDEFIATVAALDLQPVRARLTRGEARKVLGTLAAAQTIADGMKQRVEKHRARRYGSSSVRMNASRRSSSDVVIWRNGDSGRACEHSLCKCVRSRCCPARVHVQQIAGVGPLVR
jgi:hypothetical protein